MKVYDVSKKDLFDIFDQFSENATNTKNVEDFALKVLKNLSFFCDVDWSKIKKFVDKQKTEEESE